MQTDGLPGREARGLKQSRRGAARNGTRKGRGMDEKEVLKRLKSAAVPEDAEPMAHYMKDQFRFLGVKSVSRRKAIRELIRAERCGPVDWRFVRACWDSDYREMQYAALDYLDAVSGRLGSMEDLGHLLELAGLKPWWDTIDPLAALVGAAAERDPSVQEAVRRLADHPDFWFRRIAIDHQLKRKERTDTALLEEILVKNFGSREFFINKAIGWSLREYAKTDPAWVCGFLDRYRDRMAPLSVREASKHL